MNYIFRLIVSIKSWISRKRGRWHRDCPFCSAWQGHGPTCICATKKELLAAYNHTQGRLKQEIDTGRECIHRWAEYYREEKAANKILKHENNKLRHAKYPGK